MQIDSHPADVREASLLVRPDVGRRISKVATVGLKRCQILLDKPLSLVSAFRRYMVQFATDRMAAEIDPVRLRIKQMKMPRLIDLI